MKQFQKSLERWWIQASGQLGDVWAGAGTAPQVLSGHETGETVRICFRNYCDYPLILCWVSDKGKPHHFYRLDPCLIKSNTEVVTEEDRLETSKVGHAFLLAYCPEDEIKGVRQRKSLQGTTFVGGYRPRQTGPDSTPVHIVDILPQRRGSQWTDCSQPVLRVKKDDDDDNGSDDCWKLRISLAKVDPTPVDSTTKKYTATNLGGWPVMIDPDWEKIDEKARQNLEQDLEQLCRRFPPHAVKYLQANTPVWINRSLHYGPRAVSVRGRGCCFHPGVGWLLDNGMHANKVQSVEIYDVEEYNEDRDLWGTGGVMLHEFSHAYHYKCMKDGYDNKEILECYEAAMKDGLYDNVPVHGPQGPTARAYACDNQMEYFAELSSAFLGGTDDQSGVEFNKWYPFNRAQIKEHDPRAYALLKKVWKIEENGNK